MASPPLRILYHHRIAAADGMRVHIEEVVGALRDRGHVVRILGPAAADEGARAGSASTLERAAERLRALLPPAGYELLELLYNLPAYVRLSAAARSFKPDIIYERYNLFLLAGLLLRRRRRVPLLLEVNSPLAAERSEFGGLKLRRLAQGCETALWRGADVVLPVTGVLARDVARVRGGRGGIQVVPNGANLDHRPGAEAAHAARRRLGLPPGALVLGFVGFLRAWHGAGWAVDALPALPSHTHLVVVGDGPALGDLEARAKQLGMTSRLHLTGRVPHSDVPAIMETFDIALQTASVRYASPLKLFEYMGLGLAIIAPDQENIREVLTDGRNALLFEPRSEAGFRDALDRLCRDDALRAELGDAALRTVRETPLTWARNAERIEGLARALIAAADRPVEAGSPAVGDEQAIPPSPGF